jgi:Na+-transporting NADH:ubiquinone oxidoreductase subunit A
LKIKVSIINMNKKILLTTGLILTLFEISFAQSSFSSGTMTYIIVGIAAFVGLMALFSITDNLMKVEASKLGLDVEKKDIGILPSVTNLFSSKAKHLVGENSGYHQLKKGHDIKLAGVPSKDIIKMGVSRFAISPYDFRGMSPIPKVTVEVGDIVKAGDPLFYDKKIPEIIYTAPVSGEVIEINRGDKRAIKNVVILADKDISFKEFSTDESTVEAIKMTMAESGAWSLLNQRPYDIVPALSEVPRDIFISTFDSAPLAPDNSLIVNGKEAHFQKGIDILAKLTAGSVYLGLDASQTNSVFANLSNVKKHYFKGKHPAGNVGIQIHNIKPIKPGQKVWTLGVQEVLTIGKLFNEGIMDYSRILAIGGSRITNPSHVSTYTGANIGELIKNQIKSTDKEARIIDGDVLSGQHKTENDYLSYKADQISVISEGNYYELFGWLLPIKPRPSTSNTFPNFLYPDYKFEGDTNTHGEKRAFVVTGQYEDVLPMDIYPQHLAKAIMANDFERMEGLGINELSEEDVALCEFVCTSKIPLQSIVRNGLDIVRSQE